MPILDDVAAQRQKLAEKLARVDVERTKLAEQLAELEAAERVLSRLAPTKAASPRRGRRAPKTEATTTKPAPAPATRRGVRLNKHYPWAMPRCVRSVRWVTMSRPNRSAPISESNSACRCVRTTSAWPCSATAVAAGSVSLTRAGLWWRRNQTAHQPRLDPLAPDPGPQSARRAVTHVRRSELDSRLWPLWPSSLRLLLPLPLAARSSRTA